MSRTMEQDGVVNEQSEALEPELPRTITGSIIEVRETDEGEIVVKVLTTEHTEGVRSHREERLIEGAAAEMVRAFVDFAAKTCGRLIEVADRRIG